MNEHIKNIEELPSINTRTVLFEKNQSFWTFRNELGEIERVYKLEDVIDRLYYSK